MCSLLLVIFRVAVVVSCLLYLMSLSFTFQQLFTILVCFSAKISSQVCKYFLRKVSLTTHRLNILVTLASIYLLSSDFSLGYPPLSSDFSLGYPPLSSDLSLGYPPLSSDLSLGYPPLSSDFSLG